MHWKGGAGCPRAPGGGQRRGFSLWWGMYRVYSFSTVAVTNDAEIRGLKEGNSFLLGPTSTMGTTVLALGCRQGCLPSGSSRGECVSLPSPASRGTWTPWPTPPPKPSQLTMSGQVLLLLHLSDDDSSASFPPFNKICAWFRSMWLMQDNRPIFRSVDEQP